MNEFSQRIWQVENCENLELKFELFEKLFNEFNTGVFDEFLAKNENANLDFAKKAPLLKPSYAAFCKVVKLKDVSKKHALTATQKANLPHQKDTALLHTVAHIEFSAIDLALDAAYRFDGLPRTYYHDWLCVASDEVRHFWMLRKKLNELGFDYGDFVVHDGLFEALAKTQNSFLERMALVPRYMESNGLEANAFMRSKVPPSWQEMLDVIFEEEISHVSKGDRWFKFACEVAGVSASCWFDVVLKHFPNAFKNGRVLCEEARLKAGFSTNELEKMREMSER